MPTTMTRSLVDAQTLIARAEACGPTSSGDLQGN
jgi:hypothetical protein